jgi:polyferredoxin
VVKAAFLLFFVSPFIFLLGAPDHYVYSLLGGGLNQPLLGLPYGQSVCTIWTYAYAQVGPFAWLICPVGGLQTLVTGQVALEFLLPTVAALLLFLVPIFLLGNFFCGWICPLGSIIDGFDKAVARFLRGVEAKREERMRRSKEKEAAKKASALDAVACPACPFSRLVSNRFGGVAANGILLSSIAASAVLRFPVFCAVCPIGITTRGMFHLKAWTFISGTMMPIILELFAIPLVAVLASLREKRYWCRKICPVGATLNVAGSFSPLLKPKVQGDRCIMKECPKTCEDYHLDFCGACRKTDNKKCERVCPQGINLLENGSLAKCIKCMECYIECDKGAIAVETVGKSEALTALKGFFKRKPKAVAPTKQT